MRGGLAEDRAYEERMQHVLVITLLKSTSESVSWPTKQLKQKLKSISWKSHPMDRVSCSEEGT